MDIVLALHQFPPFGAGGTELLAGWIADALRAKGHVVRLVSAIPHGTTMEGVALPPREAVRFVPPAPPSGNSADRIRREHDDPRMGDAFMAALDDRRPDVVHFLHLAGLTTAALRAAQLGGIPTIFTATDFWFECPTVQRLLCDHSRCDGPNPDRLNCARHLMEIRHPALHGLSVASALDRPAAAALRLAARVPALRRSAASFDALASRTPGVRTALASADAVIAPTCHMRDRLARFGVPQARLHVVRYGIPPPGDIAPRASQRAGVLRLAYIGTFAAHKGPHLVVEALARVQGLALRVDLHGTLADTDYCRRLASAARRDARIRLCGPFAAGEMANVLRDVDVLVIPSLWDENAPLVLLQAMAHRCPVLVADVPGLTEPMQEGSHGWTFRCNDADDLAAGLRRLVAAPGLVERVRNAPVAIRSVDDHVTELETLYESCGAAAMAR